MASFYQMLDRQVNDTDVDVKKDFARYHRHIFDDQKDSVSIRKVKELNNKRYEDFEKDHLLPHCTDGKIKASEASLRWMVYEDEKEVSQTYLMMVSGLIRPADEKLAKFWIDEFKKDITLLYKYGPNVISSGYGSIIDYFREWYVKEKWAKIYSQGKTFEEYVGLAKKNADLLQGKEMPFDLTAIKEKAEILMKLRN